MPSLDIPFLDDVPLAGFLALLCAPCQVQFQLGLGFSDPIPIQPSSIPIFLPDYLSLRSVNSSISWSLQPRQPPILMPPIRSLTLVCNRSSIASPHVGAVYYLGHKVILDAFQEPPGTAYRAASPADVRVVEVPHKN